MTSPQFLRWREFYRKEENGEDGKERAQGCLAIEFRISHN
jgi:hypothetical protein